MSELSTPKWRVILICLSLLGLFLGVYLYVGRFKGALIDDAFITLGYARTLRDHHVWGFYPDSPLNSATSPLNVILLALLGSFAGGMLNAVSAVAALSITTFAIALGKLSSDLYGHFWLPILAVPLLLLNPLVLSTLGLESLPYLSIMAVCLLMFHEGRSLWLGLSCGLLVLTRPDGILLSIILLTLSQKPRLLSALTFVPIPLLWVVFAWRFLGSALPDSLFIKTYQESWQGVDFSTGYKIYLTQYPMAALLSIIPAFAFPVFLELRDSPLRVCLALLGYAVLYCAGYALLGVPPYHWYYVAPLMALILITALAVTSKPRALPIICLLLPCLLTLFIFNSASEAPIHTNWATSSQYRVIANWLNDNLPNDYQIRVIGEIGTLGYYAKQHLGDVFTSATEQNALFRNQTSDGGLKGMLLRANCAYRRSPSVIVYDYELHGYKNATDADTSNAVMSWHCSSSWTDNSIYVLRKPSP